MSIGFAWFATIHDSILKREQKLANQQKNSVKKVLVDHFKSFHDPVASLIEATDEMAIVHEDAVAFKHFPKGISFHPVAYMIS